MSLSAIDNLIQSSLESEDECLRLEWISCEGITNRQPTHIDNVYYAVRNNRRLVILLRLGNSKECTPTLVNEFARIYSLPTHKCNNRDNQFGRYKRWLKNRNYLIKGFTNYGNDCYMVAHRRFYDFYSRYGFCSTCGLLRCSPVWCTCGCKQLSNGWTSNNKKLDELIKKSQLQTNSANQAYLEWIPSDCIDERGKYAYLYGLPTDEYVELIPLEITEETNDLYYTELCYEHPDMLTMNAWVTIGFTYDVGEQKYYIIKDEYRHKLCLACTHRLEPMINAFCFECKAPAPLDWTTGNKSLDSFIMESWSNAIDISDAYIQWIEHSLLTNIQEITSLHHGCTHIAELEHLDSTTDELIRVSLKRIVDEQNDQLFNFHQLSKEYPEILTPDNIWIIGITQEPSTREYFLVFYHDIYVLLDKIINSRDTVRYMQYSDFHKFKEIGSSSYRTVYTARYKNYLEDDVEEIVVLKRFKSFDETLKLFISEFGNHVKCSGYHGFLQIYGYTQNPVTKEYMIAMQYANNGSLLSYLGQNINRLTWSDKLECLARIAWQLRTIHIMGLLHCNLHGGNINMHANTRGTTPVLCDLGLSRSVNSCRQDSNTRGVLPFVAPEVFYTRKFTQKSDVYSFGIVMYLIATGEQPFKDRQFDGDLICEILGGLRPSMPDSTPEGYKKLAERCCDADPDKRPDSGDTLLSGIYELINSR